MNRFRIALIAGGGLMVLLLVFWASGWFSSGGSASSDAISGLDSDEIARVAANPNEVKQKQRALAKLQPKEPYIVIDRYSNRLYLRTKDSVLVAADCSTGSGAELTDTATGRTWKFDTPVGVFKVDSKLVDPWWRKPDWAFVEEGTQVPEDEQERMDPEMLGEYALGYGDGYFIHGTIYERLLGVGVTHGCTRLGSEDIKQIYKRAKIGTKVYVY